MDTELKETEWSPAETFVYTMRMSLGHDAVLCDPVTNVKHTGNWFQTRRGKTGRFPKHFDFHTNCGKDLKVTTHQCGHDLPDCPDCITAKK